MCLAELELVAGGEFHLAGHPESSGGGHIDVAVPVDAGCRDGAGHAPAFECGLRFGFGAAAGTGLFLAEHRGAQLIGALVDVEVDTVGTGLNGDVVSVGSSAAFLSAPVEIPGVVAGELEFGRFGEGVVDVEAVEILVVSHLHIGVTGVPFVECADDSDVVEAVELGEHEGAGVEGESVVALAVALDVLGTAAGDDLDGGSLGLFGLGFRTPVLGGVVPVAYAGQLEAACRAVLAEVDKSGECSAGLFVVVEVLVDFLEAPRADCRAGTDDPDVVIGVHVEDEGVVRSQLDGSDVGKHFRGCDGIALIVGDAGAELEIQGEGHVGFSSETQYLGVEILLGEGYLSCALVFIDSDLCSHLGLVGHIRCARSVEGVALGCVYFEVCRRECGNKVGSAVSKNCFGEVAKRLHGGGVRVVHYLDVFLLAGSEHQACGRNEKCIK